MSREIKSHLLQVLRVAVAFFVHLDLVHLEQVLATAEETTGINLLRVH
jgi:hypothetical protein